MSATRQPTTQGDAVNDGRQRAAFWPALLAATLLLVGFGGAAAVGPVAADPADCPAAVSTTAPIDRVAGADRFATATCASRATFEDGVDHVVLARGDAAGGLADALTGAVLAHAVDGPVLLTSPQTLPAATAAELDRLAPERITILGGEAAVAEAALDEIADLLEGATLDRLAGADRAETAALVSEAAGGQDVAFVVNGHRPADALVAAELAATYEVDAVALDYIRYVDARWGYHPTSLARFHAATGAVGTRAEDDLAWNAWRRAQVDALTRRAAAAVRAADPDVAVTLAASTMGAGPVSAGGYERTRTYRDVFQDWPSWLADGTIDAALPMNYFRAHVAAEQAWFDDWTTWQRDLPRGDAVLAGGQAGFLNDVDGSLAQIAAAHQRSDGAVVDSYQGTTSAGPGQQLLTRLAATLWSEPAPPPASITAP